MTAKELFEKHGPGVWWAEKIRPELKHFRPLGFNTLGDKIIGETVASFAVWYYSTNPDYVLHQPPKQKVVRWKWAYQSNFGEWKESEYFLTEAQAENIYMHDYRKLDYTKQEFKE
jgi:hypothetical protein